MINLPFWNHPSRLRKKNQTTFTLKMQRRLAEQKTLIRSTLLRRFYYNIHRFGSSGSVGTPHKLLDETGETVSDHLSL